MLALDFKLTSGQVRALLFIYATEGLSNEEHARAYAAPESQFFHTPHFLSSVESLQRKGLTVHRKPDATDNFARGKVWRESHEQYGHFLTADGRACVQLIITQAQHIAALASMVRSRGNQAPATAGEVK